MGQHWMDAYPVGTIWIHTNHLNDPDWFKVVKISDYNFLHIGRQHTGKVVYRDNNTKRNYFSDYFVPKNEGVGEIEWI